jgi:hypothetical protein
LRTSVELYLDVNQDLFHLDIQEYLLTTEN